MTTPTRLTDTELSAEFFAATLDLHQAQTPDKVGAACRMLTVQRFAPTPHRDTETP